MGCELAPFAMMADKMLSSKVNFGIVNNNLIFEYKEKKLLFWMNWKEFWRKSRKNSIK
ncbi:MULTISPECIES: hypothetical protein [unclassified Clostridium]|uniref:hypothetical protein n=1 Tax=unclassified Clostridium TaxID=2614128 RepID=UPI00207A1D0B|nr:MULTISPECIES: hypothetical protein [unclassified Clostridium]